MVVNTVSLGETLLTNAVHSGAKPMPNGRCHLRRRCRWERKHTTGGLWALARRTVQC